MCLPFGDFRDFEGRKTLFLVEDEAETVKLKQRGRHTETDSQTEADKETDRQR